MIPKRIVLAAHILVTGPVHELHRYLQSRCDHLLCLWHPLQPFTPVGDHWSVFERYTRGRLVERRTLRQWPLVPHLTTELILFARQAWLTLWWGLTQAGGSELFIGMNPLNAFVGILLKRLRRVQGVIFYTIDYVPNRFPQRWLNAAYHWVDRFCVRHADQVWNLSGRMVEAREAHGISPRYRAKQIVVPMGTDGQFTSYPDGPVERTTAVYFGGLMEKQGVQLGIEALPLLRRSVPQARLLVIGGGRPEDRARLERLAQTLGVSQAVEFTGVIADHDEALARLRRCAVGIAPYTDSKDNFTRNTDPGKPKAYLSAGLPVVITDVPEIAQIIDRAGAGFTIPYDAAALAGALARLFTDDDLFTRCRQHARALAGEYRWDLIFDRAFTVKTEGGHAGRVSVIIPTYNGRDLILSCLTSLSQQTYQEVEVIVVDNGSADGTLAAVQQEFPSVRCVANPENLGFVGGCHRGASAATGEFLLFLNNDTVHEPSFIVTLVQAMREDPQMGLCASKVLLEPDRRRLDGIGSIMTATGFLAHLGLYEPDDGRLDGAREIFSPKGVSLLIRKRLFETLGRFDEQFFAYFDESDLAWRVWLSGRTVRVIPASVVYHASTSTASRLDPNLVNFHVFKNRIRSLLKNFGALRLLRTLPLHLALCGSIALLHLVRGRLKAAGAILKALGWNLRHLPETLALRRRIQRTIRRRSDREIFRRFSAGTSWRDVVQLYRWYMDFWERRESPVQAHATRHLKYIPGFEDGQADVYHRIAYEYAKPYLSRGRSLNLGCWTGGFESAALEEIPNLLSIDLELSALRIAAQASPRGRFLCALGQQLPLPDATFDVVTFFTVLEHLPAGREVEVLREIARVLAPGGMLILTTPQYHWLGNVSDIAWWLVGHRHYRVAEVAALVRQAGMEVDRVDLRGRWFSNATILIFYLGKYLFRKNAHRHPWVTRKLAQEYQRPGYRDIFLVACKPRPSGVMERPGPLPCAEGAGAIQASSFSKGHS